MLEEPKNKLRKFEKLLKCLYLILKSLSLSESTPRKVFCFTVPLEQERLLLLELLQIELMLALYESSGQSSSKNMSEKEQEWSERFSKWQEQRKPQLFSLMKLMQLEVQDTTMVKEVTMKFKEQCLKLSINSMDLMPEEM